MEKFQHRSFKRFFAILLASELIVVFMAWLLLDVGITFWIRGKTRKLLRIAQKAAAEVDWSHLDEIEKGKADSPVFQNYRKRILALNQKYFPGGGGDLAALVVVKGREGFQVASDLEPYELTDETTPFEQVAMETGKPTFSPTPYSDSLGTHLTAFAPVLKGGKVLALIAADFDATSLQELQGDCQNGLLVVDPPGLLRLHSGGLLPGRPFCRTAPVSPADSGPPVQIASGLPHLRQ